MKNEKIAYLCDGTACSRMCANRSKEERDMIQCKHTLKEAFAKNKCRRKRKFKNVRGGLVEVEQ